MAWKVTQDASTGVVDASRVRMLSGHSLTQRTETAICFWPWGPR